MAITINLYYHGQGDNARKYAQEMMDSGVVDEIRNEPGNLRYEYYIPLDDPTTVLLIDSWQDQKALDIHHSSPTMQKIMNLREKYDLHMEVFRYVSDTSDSSGDNQFIRQ